jgi:hypothetical protein
LFFGSFGSSVSILQILFFYHNIFCELKILVLSSNTNKRRIGSAESPCYHFFNDI